MTGFCLQSHFADAMGALLGPDFPDTIGLAVSGGGDSMAMLTLAHNWTHQYGVTLRVVTVDHGLRAESADEAEFVARTCAELGHSHSTLRWQGPSGPGWDGHGNLQDAARAARLSLIEDWRGSLRHVLMAHTADDQAETFLMRLARGSGVDGLASIPEKRFVPSGPQAADREAADSGFWLIRPLLNARRADLRHYLTVLKGTWVDDPSNDDPKYDRVRMRQAMDLLQPLGLDVPTLTQTATRMARARDGLQRRAQNAAAELVRAQYGDLLFDRDALAALDAETRLRLLAVGLQYVAVQPYRPRAQALEATAERVLSGGHGTLHGCMIRAEKTDIRICREYRAVAATTAQVGDIWDQRVRIQGPKITGMTVRALGAEGAAQLDQRPAGLPYQSLIAQPAVFERDRLHAFAPAGYGPAHTTDYFAGQGSFPNFIRMH
ncbi:tRNA lysidine(34) synthetase TilS [Phaeobacter sp. J2-8]|uniref:tRNA lysidine(34) synthetase TilS n=1 Tax=Phaeobacter sp. J2-8 TaxID=2931394 RepID=UPI001FD17E15|nr:tRNA lysidine(34) synthetase TilS [Phaeobacter sp. J2-8]MCJ7873000.1 tRNA lysidine(34) synthetase TilS [Phaeobacter sp. J2-8]